MGLPTWCTGLGGATYLVYRIRWDNLPGVQDWVGLLSVSPTLTVCEREGRHKMDEQVANYQNKSPEAPRDYKLPEAYNLLEEQMKDSDWLEA